MTTPTLAEKLVDVLPCQGESYGETCEFEKCLPCQACNARPRILAFIESELAERVAKARREAIEECARITEQTPSDIYGLCDAAAAPIRALLDPTP